MAGKQHCTQASSVSVDINCDNCTVFVEVLGKQNCRQASSVSVDIKCDSCTVLVEVLGKQVTDIKTVMRSHPYWWHLDLLLQFVDYHSSGSQHQCNNEQHCCEGCSAYSGNGCDP